MPRLLVSSGEASGELYAAELVRHVRGLTGSLEVIGLGGDRLAAEGAMLVAHVRELAVVGLLEVVSHLPRLRRVLASLLQEVERRPPDLAVLIDYPDFNLRLARELRRRGVRVAYYVSPQIWAWRRGRIRTIRETAEKMLVIFPFEEALYREAGVPVSFVGHPLVDLVRPAPDPAAFVREIGLDPARPVVAVLPGSRPKEVRHILPGLAGAIEILAGRHPGLQFVVAQAPALDESLYAEVASRPDVRLVRGRAHEALSAASVGLVASGTATVEAAILGTPMVVVYRLSPLTYALGKPLVQVPHYAMANLIAGRRIVPELVQADFTPVRVAHEAGALLSDAVLRERTRADLAEVRRRLGEPGASARAAAEIAALLRSHA
jgi:lipid-A-disaccharide synthase